MNTIEHLEELLMVLEAGRDTCQEQTRAFTAYCRCIDFVTDLLNTHKAIGCDYCQHPLFAGTKCNNCGAKQAQIDRLMLEHCPNEMTAEQVVEWSKNQKPVKQEFTKNA